jgi:hypothetical protein
MDWKMSQLSDQSTTRISLVAIQGRGLSTFVVLGAGLKIVFGGRRKM